MTKRTNSFFPLIMIAFLAISVLSASAMPPLPSSFYGTVKINGANVPDGTTISARINNIEYAWTVVLEYGGETVFSLDVPGDDPGTPDVEGGIPGSLISFYISDAVADQTAIWQSGTNIELNLTAPYQLPLTVNKDGTGSGTITSNPAGINCGTTCSADFNYNSVVTLTAIPDSDYFFVGWSGACVGTGACKVTMTAEKSVTATFDQPTVIQPIFFFLPLVIH